MFRPTGAAPPLSLVESLKIKNLEIKMLMNDRRQARNMLRNLATIVIAYTPKDGDDDIQMVRTMASKILDSVPEQ